MSRAMRWFTGGVALLAALAVTTGVLVLNRGPDLVDLATLDVMTVERDPGIALPHHLAVPAAAAGCPAFGVDAPVPPREPPSAHGTWLALDEDLGRTVQLVCLGSVDQVGPLGEVVGAVPRDGADGSVRYPTPVWVESPFGRALRVTTHFTATGTSLTEWFTERDGHVFAVGHLHDVGDTTWVPTVEAMLTTWDWVAVSTPRPSR